MKKSFLIVGLGRFGACVAKTLAQMNCDVLAIDIDEESVAAIANDVTHAIVADSTKMDILNSLGTKNIDHAIIAIGNNLQASILTVVNLRKLGVKMITVRADTVEYKELFSLIGANEVIIPEEESAILLANQVRSDSILDYYIISDNNVMVKISVGVDLKKKTIIDLDIRNRFSVNIVGIIRDNKFFIPHATDTLLIGDIAVVVGLKNDINKFDNFLNN